MNKILEKRFRCPSCGNIYTAAVWYDAEGKGRPNKNMFCACADNTVWSTDREDSPEAVWYGRVPKYFKCVPVKKGGS